MKAKPRPLSARPAAADYDNDADPHPHGDDDAAVLLQVAPTPCGGVRTPRGTTTTATTLDAAFSKHVGELGPAQLKHCLLGSLSWATLAMAVLSLVFLTPDPVRAGDWACVPSSSPSAASAAAAAQQACAALKAQQRQPPSSSDSPLLTAQSPAFCALPRDSWRWTNARKSAVAAFDLQCERAALATAASSALFVGFLLASSWWGALADRRGRRAAALASGWLSAAASLLSAIAPTYPALLLARALLGAAVAGLPVSLYPLCVEIAGPRARGRAGILSQAVYHLGEWLLPLLAWLLADWRLLCLAVAVSGALTTLLAHAVPESPRWLLVRGREAEARRVLQALAKGNGRLEGLPPGLRLGLYASAASPTVGARAAAAASLSLPPSPLPLPAYPLSPSPCAAPPPPACPPPPSSNPKPNPKHLEHEHGNQEEEGSQGLAELWRHRRSRAFVVAVSVATFVAAAGFYVCSLVDALPGSLALTFFMTSIAELPFALALAHWVDAWGRKPAVAALLAGGGLAAAVCGASPASARALQLVSATVAKGAISAAWGGLVTWSAELFSTSLRAQALAVSNQSARLGGVLAPFVAHAAARAGWPEGQFFVAGLAAMLVAALVGWTLPETRGVAQPDTLADVDAIFGGGGRKEGGGGGRAATTTTMMPLTPVASPSAAAAAAEVGRRVLASAASSAGGGGGGERGGGGGGGGDGDMALVARPSSTESMRSGGWAPLLQSQQQQQQHQQQQQQQQHAMVAAGKEAGAAAAPGGG
jgi:MFS family permease